MIADDRLAGFYLSIKQLVEGRGFALELAWHERLPHHRHSEREVLEEAVWVIVSVGLADRVVRAIHPRLVEAFDGLPSADHLVRHRGRLQAAAASAFRHAGKVEAILQFAAHLAHVGCDHFLAALHHDPELALRGLGYFGPASSLHLAKNLGVPVAKPDRHLLRIAAMTGLPPQALCARIARLSNDDVVVIDYVLWRYLSFDPAYLSLACRFLAPGGEPAPVRRPRPAKRRLRVAIDRHQTQTTVP